MSTFKVGEVCVGINFIFDTQYNGVECVIVAPARPMTSINQASKIVSSDAKYEVKWNDGKLDFVRPRNLRRKQPPAGEQSIMDMFKLPQQHKEPA